MDAVAQEEVELVVLSVVDGRNARFYPFRHSLAASLRIFARDVVEDCEGLLVDEGHELVSVDQGDVLVVFEHLLYVLQDVLGHEVLHFLLSHHLSVEVVVADRGSYLDEVHQPISELVLERRKAHFVLTFFELRKILANELNFDSLVPGVEPLVVLRFEVFHPIFCMRGELLVVGTVLIVLADVGKSLSERRFKIFNIFGVIDKFLLIIVYGSLTVSFVK